MRPDYDCVRLVMLCGRDQKRTLVEMLTIALSGVRPAQRDCADPDLYIEGSTTRYGDTVRCNLALASMHNHVVLVAVRRFYAASLAHGTIAKDAADLLWQKIEARSAGRLT